MRRLVVAGCVHGLGWWVGGWWATQYPPVCLEAILLVLCLEGSLGVAILSLLKQFKKNDATRAWIKEAGRMNHLKHVVPLGYHYYNYRIIITIAGYH